MRVLVVDDEAPARRRLIRMLEGLPDTRVAGEAADGIEALEQIERLQPDVVLLDIRMPGLDGLGVAGASPALPPVVFTTAHDEYAVEAFEVAALDYLLKPVRKERLAAALERVRERRGGGLDAERLRRLLERIESRQDAGPVPVSARAGNLVRVFDARAIPRFYASAKYSVFQSRGVEYVLDESLAALERRLGGIGFLRVHRGQLVNLAHVRALRSEDGSHWVELSDASRAPVSRRLLAELKQRLGIGAGRARQDAGRAC